MRSGRMAVMTLMASATCGVLWSCSTLPPPAHPDQPDLVHAFRDSTHDPAAADLADSDVNIRYVLGHDHYRFQAKAQAEVEQFAAESYLDHRIVKGGSIDKRHYAQFLKKASYFVTSQKRELAEQLPCRTPFTVTVRIKKDSKSATGCRSSDEGSFSRLVKEGEFLLYSKK